MAMSSTRAANLAHGAATLHDLGDDHDEDGSEVGGRRDCNCCRHVAQAHESWHVALVVVVTVVVYISSGLLGTAVKGVVRSEKPKRALPTERHSRCS